MHGILKMHIEGFEVHADKPLLTIYFRPQGAGGMEPSQGHFDMIDGRPLTQHEVDSDVWQGEDIEPMHMGASPHHLEGFGGQPLIETPDDNMKKKKKLRKKPKRKGQGHYES